MGWKPMISMTNERTSGLYSERFIPEVPRLRSRRAGRLQPLAIYSIFVSVSLVLLGSMAVASLPM